MINDGSIELSDRSRSKSKSLSGSGKNSSSSDNIEREIDFERIPKVTYCSAIREILKRSGPAMVGMIIRRLVDLINIYFVGHMDNSDYVAGVGLAVMTYSVVWYTVTIGMAGGIDTLSSQAFGNKHYYLAGNYLNRARVIMTVLFIPQALIWYYAENILVFFNQPYDSAHYAGIYLKLLLPGLYGMTQFELTRRFLATQGVFALVVIIQVITMILHVILLYIFLILDSQDISTMAIITSVTHLLNFLGLSFYISFKGDVVHPDSWHFINSDSFKGIWKYLIYGFPSLIMTVLEFWVYEIFVIVSGYIGIHYQSAAVTIINIIATIYVFSVGMSMAATSWVGKSIGAGEPDNAKVYAFASVILSILAIGTILPILLIFRYHIFHLFVQHQEIIDIIMPTIPIYWMMLIGDYVHEVERGVLTAVGYQKYATYINLFGYWLVGIPLALLGYYYDLKLIGIWGGIGIGSWLVAFLFTIILLRADWDEICTYTAFRIRAEKTHLRLPSYSEYNDHDELLSD